MPHQQLKFQGGVIETETPVINQTGIASSNRIRFLPDIQGLSLPQKLGGWARFFASQITAGVVRALWGWQDTANNQWIALGIDNSPVQLQAIQCTVNGATGLTSATGTPQNLMPNARTTTALPGVEVLVGSNVFSITDPNLSSVPATIQTVYITTPISVAGVVLQGLYSVSSPSPPFYNITAFDILGNPLNAAHSTITSVPINSVTFTGGSPNKLTITYTGVGIVPVGENVNVIVADNSITGSYIVLSSGSGTFTVATTLSSYTYATTGDWNTEGVTPIFQTTNGSATVEVIFPYHNLSVGEEFDVLNPTLVGGIIIQGAYTVQSVVNSYEFTIAAAALATASSQQYQGAQAITGGSRSGTAVTIDYAQLVNFNYAIPNGDPVFVQGVNPATWNGTYNVTATGTGTITYTDSSASGTYISGGSWSPIGGLVAFVYSTNYNVVGSLGTSGGFWSLDNWGNDLVGVYEDSAIITYPTLTLPYQPIFYWDATTLPPAMVIGSGPPASNGLFVAMPQRQIIAWGSSFSGIIDPLLIRWCDINDFNTWVAQVTNQAGSFRLSSGSNIIGARQAFQQGIIWTDIEVWSMTYINQPYVYSFNKIGQGCGLIGKYAHGVLNNVVYWMGKSQFFMLSGEGVTILSCPIWDVAFQDLDLVNKDKVTCGTNAMFNEVTWYFPIVGGTGENSNYVKYNVVAGVWDFGVLDRSAWIDVSVLQQPIGFSPANQYIYQHEISPDADGAAMGETFTTGWFALAEGDVMPYVDQFWPDFKWGYYDQSQNASLSMSFTSQAYPGAAQYSYGPYTISESTSYISPRIRNRLINFTVNGAGTGTWWRLGGIRYRMQGDGKY